MSSSSRVNGSNRGSPNEASPKPPSPSIHEPLATRYGLRQASVALGQAVANRTRRTCDGPVNRGAAWSAVALYRFSNLLTERRAKSPAVVAPKRFGAVALHRFSTLGRALEKREGLWRCWA